ncbi:MAG: peptidoglycan editing factor PgeF [Burkholderiaceae bacterium]
MTSRHPAIVRVVCPVPGVGLAYTQRGLNASACSSAGDSPTPYSAFNLGLHVGDDPAAVYANRQALEQALEARPFWLQQVHGTRVIRVEEEDLSDARLQDGLGPKADASVSTLMGHACAILTADCLPVLMASGNGQVVGGAHAGWRGLANGVIESLIDAMQAASPEDCASGLWAWLGPCIGFDQFEVGEEVVAALKANQAEDVDFKPSPAGRWLADMPQIASRQINLALAARGLRGIAISNDAACTFSNPYAFYSYRREPKTGRMAALIWRTGDQ